MQQPQQTEKVIPSACFHPLTDKLSQERDNRGLIVGICVVRARRWHAAVQSRPLTTPLLAWHYLSSAMSPSSGGTIRKGQSQLVPMLSSWSLWLCSQAPAESSCSNSVTQHPAGTVELKLCFTNSEQAIYSNAVIRHSNN